MKIVSTCPWCGSPILMSKGHSTLDDPQPEPELTRMCECREVLYAVAGALVEKFGGLPGEHRENAPSS